MNLHNILIFGDSYSTYAGHIPAGYAVYYSGKRETPPDLADVSETWWHRLITETGSTLIRNDSWSGSTICYTGYNNTDCSETSSFICRFNKLKQAGFFRENTIDTVFVFGATNDNWANSPVGELQFEGWKKEDLFSILPAVCHFLNLLKEELSQAEIVFVINTSFKEAVRCGIEEACRHYGIRAIQLKDIDKVNGHPTSTGMEQIKDQILIAMNGDN